MNLCRFFAHLHTEREIMMKRKKEIGELKGTYIATKKF